MEDTYYDKTKKAIEGMSYEQARKLLLDIKWNIEMIDHWSIANERQISAVEKLLREIENGNR